MIEHENETVFRFMVPVYVTVSEGRVRAVHVEDSVPVEGAVLIDTDEDDGPLALKRAVEIAGDSEWPAWRFGW